MKISTVLFLLLPLVCGTPSVHWDGPWFAAGQECPLPFSPSSIPNSQSYNYSSPAFQNLTTTLHNAVENYVAQHNIKSYAVAVVHQNRPILKSGLTSTPFRIASVTKTITALGALMLREQGLLSLDDPVNKFLPNFTIINPFGQHDTTVRELMGHAAGFPRDLCPMLMTCTSNETEILEQIAGMQLISPPWTDYPAYSNMGISLLGHTWEKATAPRQSWEQYVMNKILRPLQMKDTGVNLTGVNLAANNNAYARQDLGWSAPAAQMYSTADDLTKYLGFLLNADPPLISETSISEWISPATIFPDGLGGFAYPWELQKLQENSSDFVVTKSGNINGYLSYIAFDPPTQLGIVALMVQEQGISGSPDELGGNLLVSAIPAVQSINQQIISDQYAGVYKCKGSGKFAAPTLNYTVQFTRGTIEVSVSPTVGLLANVDLGLINAGQKVSTANTWAFLLKNATENSFWFGDGTSCQGIMGAVSGGPDLRSPNAPGSLYTNVIKFDTETGSLEWPAVAARCYKSGSESLKRSLYSLTSSLVAILFSLIFLDFIF